MIAEPNERRSSKRYSVETARAEVSVHFGGADHDAVLADMSGSGFGLLMMKGSRVDPGERIQLTSFDGATVFHLEVVHVRTEDVFQHVGLCRLHEESQQDVALFRQQAPTHQVGMSGVSPLVFLGTVVGFSTACIGLVELFRSAPEESNGHQRWIAEQNQALTEAMTQSSPEEKRRRLLERSGRAEPGWFPERPEWAPNMWMLLTGADQKLVEEFMGGRRIAWYELVRELDLTRDQQYRILSQLNSDSMTRLRDAREEMDLVLTPEQHSKLRQLLKTLPKTGS